MKRIKGPRKLRPMLGAETFFWPDPSPLPYPLPAKPWPDPASAFLSRTPGAQIPNLTRVLVSDRGEAGGRDSCQRGPEKDILS